MQVAIQHFLINIFFELFIQEQIDLYLILISWLLTAFTLKFRLQSNN